MSIELAILISVVILGLIWAATQSKTCVHKWDTLPRKYKYADVHDKVMVTQNVLKCKHCGDMKIIEVKGD